MKEENKNSLLGKIWPHYQENMEKIMETWRELMCEDLQDIPVIEWEYLLFKIKNHKKHRVYRDLVRAFNNGWTMFKSIKEMSRFMASCSNIADNDNFKIRSETIRHGLNLQKKYI